MWSSVGHETAHLGPAMYRRRTACPTGGLTVVRCLGAALLPAPVSHGPWAARVGPRPGAGRQRSARPQHHPGVQRAGPGGSAAPVVRAASAATCRLHPRPVQVVTGIAAPEPTHQWQTDPCLDARPRRRGGVGHRADAPTRQVRDYSQCPGSLPDPLEHHSRPGVGQEKQPHARLIRLATTPPQWVLGVSDAGAARLGSVRARVARG